MNHSAVHSFAAAHEECERLQRQIVRDFKSDVKGHREKLAQGHRVRKMLNELQAQSQKLVRGQILIKEFTLLHAIGRHLPAHIKGGALHIHPRCSSPL